MTKEFDLDKNNYFYYGNTCWRRKVGITGVCSAHDGIECDQHLRKFTGIIANIFNFIDNENIENIMHQMLGINKIFEFYHSK